jgi:hypothetical protein
MQDKVCIYFSLSECGSVSKSKNPHGKGKTSVSSTLGNDILEALDYLATQSGVTRSTYAREAITEAVKTGRVFSAQEIMAARRNITETTPVPAAIKGKAPEPRIGFHAKKGNHGIHYKQTPKAVKL